MLGRAAARIDRAFAALPPSAQKATALAMYRAAPAIAQYQSDLAPLTESAELRRGLWDFLIAISFRLAKRGSAALDDKTAAEIAAAAPNIQEFLRAVIALLEGKTLVDLEALPKPAALPGKEH